MQLVPEDTSPKAETGSVGDPRQVVRDAYLDHGARLLGAARLLLGGDDVARDVVHDAFAACLARWLAHGLTDDPMAYLYRSVVNGARSRLRSGRVRQRSFPRLHAAEPPVPGEHLEETEGRAAALAAVQGLPRRQREVVVLRFYGERSVAETAAALGISEGSVKTHAHRALGALRTRLEER